MKGMKYILVPVVGLSLLYSAQADDLLSILGSSETESLVQERDELTTKLKAQKNQWSAEQNIFFDWLSKSEYEKALFQWSSAFKGDSYADTPTGKALYSYLLVKNELSLLGVEDLLAINQPEEVLPELMKVIQLELPAKHNIWSLIQVPWNPKWTAFLGESVEVKVRSYRNLDLSDLDGLFALLKKSQLDTQERNWLEWQMALGLILNGQDVKAGKVLAHLAKNPKIEIIDKNLVYLTVGRLLYGKGYLSPAISYYQMIPKSSEFWFVAQEEMAWSYIRKGEPQNTLAVTQAFMLPEFQAHVGPETLFLRALAHLKACDYQNVASTMEVFKKRFKSRSSRLLEVSKNGKRPEVDRLINQLKVGSVRLTELGSDVVWLPQFVSRDQSLKDKARSLAHMEKETKTAKDLYTKSVSGGSSQVGFQKSFADLARRVEFREQSFRDGIYNLIKQRAKEEISSIQSMLTKMHIVEAELLQQVSQATALAQASNVDSNIKAGTSVAIEENSLRFPFEGETWFDEITNYKIDLKKGCQAKRSE